VDEDATVANPGQGRPVVDEFEKFLGDERFYDLMQAYRHTPISDQAATVAAFEAVKAELRRQHFIDLEAAWGIVKELTRRMLIIEAAVRGTQRFINARQHHGQSVLDRKGAHGLVDERIHTERREVKE